MTPQAAGPKRPERSVKNALLLAQAVVIAALLGVLLWPEPAPDLPREANGGPPAPRDQGPEPDAPAPAPPGPAGAEPPADPGAASDPGPAPEAPGWNEFWCGTPHQGPGLEPGPWREGEVGTGRDADAAAREIRIRWRSGRLR